MARRQRRPVTSDRAANALQLKAARCVRSTSTSRQTRSMAVAHRPRVQRRSPLLRSATSRPTRRRAGRLLPPTAGPLRPCVRLEQLMQLMAEPCSGTHLLRAPLSAAAAGRAMAFSQAPEQATSAVVGRSKNALRVTPHLLEQTTWAMAGHSKSVLLRAARSRFARVRRTPVAQTEATAVLATSVWLPLPTVTQLVPTAPA